MATDTAVTVRGAAAMVEGGIDWKVMEEVITKGNLTKLDARTRVTYYKQVCESVGLNPLTRPLEYIEFWAGKDRGMVGQLYVTRNATDQLRRIHNVNTEILSQKIESGVLIVTVRATLPNGRSEVDIGAVPVEGADPKQYSDAQKKAVTQAKRRATLALVGLSFLDESETATLPQARILTEEDLAARYEEHLQLRANAEPPAPQPPPQPPPSNVHQHRQLYALQTHGFPLSDFLIARGYQNLADLSAEEARDMINQGRVWSRNNSTDVPVAALQPEDLEPTPAEIPIEEPPGLTKADLRQLWTVATNNGYSTAQVHALIKDLYPAAVGEDGLPSSRMLTPLGVQHLINHMESNPLGVEDGEIVGTKALQEFWAHARGVGWRSQEVQDAATRVWPALRTPMGTMDPTKLRTGQLTQLFRMVDGDLTLAQDNDGNWFLREGDSSQG